MGSLSDDEIRDIADESGLSPQEVRRSLATNAGGGALVKSQGTGLVAPSVRGKSAAFAETRLDLAPDRAVLRVRETLEKRARSKGHMQGGGEADIVDEARQVTYRVRAEGDGSAGALVRVDVDPSRAEGKRTLGMLAVIAGGASAALLAALTGSVSLWIAAGVIAGGGALGLGSYSQAIRRRVADAEAIAGQALADAEHQVGVLGPAEGRSPAALPPGHAG